MERAAVSVSNNIAEGFERGTNQELLTFLYIARGSAGEVRSMLYLLNGMQPFRNLECELRDLRERTDSISKQLGAWAGSLQDSDFKGRRYVTEKTRLAAEKVQGRKQFLQELEELRKKGRRELEAKNAGRESGPPKFEAKEQGRFRIPESRAEIPNFEF